MTTYHWSFLEDVTRYRAANVEGIAVWRRKVGEFGEDRAVELIRDSGLAVSSLSCAGGFTGADGYSFQESVDDGLEAVQLAGEMQAACLVVVSGGRAGHTHSHARRLVCEALTELGDAAAEVNLQIALQPAPRRTCASWTFLNSWEATLDVMHQCDHPHVGLAVDGLQLWHETGLGGRFADIAPWIKSVSLCDATDPLQVDSSRCLPGEGAMPLGDLLCALARAGYQGFYEVQVLTSDCWNTDYERVVAQSQAAFHSFCAPLRRYAGSR